MKNSITLEVGNRTFFDGKVYCIIGSKQHDWILSEEPVLFAVNGIPLYVDNALVVAKKRCEPVASDVFKIGDAVQSSNTFRGTVTGFEGETNRVVCISAAIDKYDNDRTRYAYKVSEIQHKPTTFTFAINRTYQLELPGKSVQVRAIEHMHSRDMFTLFDITSGKLFGNVPKIAELSDLEDNLGIRKIS